MYNWGEGGLDMRGGGLDSRGIPDTFHQSESGTKLGTNIVQ